MFLAIVPLSWMTVTWSACAAVYATLALVYLYIAVRQRSAPNLSFALAACSAAAMAAFELSLQRSTTPEEFGRILRGAHVALFFLIASVVLFIRSYLRAGRLWLAWSVVGLRGVALLANFLHEPNFNFDRIDSLQPVTILGDRIVLPVGVVSGWSWFGQFVGLLFIAFLSDATATVWRRGERRRALLIGGSTLAFVILATGHSALVHAGILRSPYVVSLSFLPVVAAMWYELTRDALRVPEMTRSLLAKEEALRQREYELSLTAQAARLSVWVWDIASDRVEMTEAARALLGLAPDEPIDLVRFLSSIHPDDRGRIERQLRESLRTPGPYERQYRTILPDGTIRWISSIGVVEADAAGAPAFVRGVSIDVTERKLEQHEFEKNRNELAHLARFTTLGELSGSLAHELNQPLAAILANAEAAQRFLAQNPPELDELRDILEDIVAEDQHAGEVIVRLRALFKKGEVIFQPMEVGGVVDDVLSLVRSELIGNDIAIEVRIPPGLPLVRADRVQVQQVLLNLVKNASDAMTAVSPSRRRLTLAVANGDGHVSLSVRDTGLGMSEEVQDRVFQPFVTTKPDGMGLGLAVCRTIVEAHSGTLRASNNAAGGATFEFTLPVDETTGGRA